MAQLETPSVDQQQQPTPETWQSATYSRSYLKWVESTGVPVYKGYFIPDSRTLELAPWPERECDAAFLQLFGQEGVTEARVSEIPAGATLPPLHFSLDEVVYVLDGQGLTTISGGESTKRTFEWQKHSMFLLPRYCTYQLSNTQGNRPVRLLHFNFMPLAMMTNPDIDFYFNNPYQDASTMGDEHAFSEAKRVVGGEGMGASQWTGNFFADMRAWDRLEPFRNRGAGGHLVSVRFPTSSIVAHMSVFPAQTYKKAHRHGPGIVIVIPSGEGYSVMWPQGHDKIFVPWHEGSVFVPPDRWFHQHFNLGTEAARYLALHSPQEMVGRSERVNNPFDQIEYSEEDPIVRQTFEGELAKRGMNSIMPEEAYKDPTYQWEYAEDKA